LKVLPRQIRWMFRKFNSNDFALEVKSPELQQLRVQLDMNGRRMSLSVLIAGLFIASSVALQHSSGELVAGYPLAAVVFFVVGCVFLLNLLFKALK